MKQWYTYTRNAIIYVQFKDRRTGKKLTAKSTGTRIKSEAEYIIRKWYYDPSSFFNKGQEATTKNILRDIIRNTILSEIDIRSMLNEVIRETFKTTCKNDASIFQNDTRPSHAAIKRKIKDNDIQTLLEELDTLTFKDFVLRFYDYDSSPYITRLKRLGKKTPCKERFNSLLSQFKKYEYLFSNTLLSEIDADEVNGILGTIQTTGNLAESSMSILKTALGQVLRFAYNNHLVNHLCTGELTKFSTISKEKEIFTKDELNIIFDKTTNVFKNKHCLLINKLLLKTGCRIGEILALQIKDLQKTGEGYRLFIGKNYNYKGHRLKSTKTNREDYVPISNEMGEELLCFIETNPFKGDQEGFIFYSEQRDCPIAYSYVYKNFNKTMAELGIRRKALTIHSYRHTFSSILQDEGYSMADLLYLTRHNDISQVVRYSNHITPVKEQKKRQAAEIIERLA